MSVIIPVYRCAPYVRACLQSVLDQTRSVDEIVLVDDCGGDDSMKVATEYLHAHGADWTTVTHERNEGLGRARNSGLTASTGDLIWFLDSDDEGDHRFVELLERAALAGGADVACCRTLRVDESGNSLGVDEPRMPASTVSGSELAHMIVRGTMKAYACTKLFRRSILGDAPWDEGQGYEDIAASIRIGLRAGTVALVDEPLYRYLYREGSISTSLGPRTLDMFKVGTDTRSALVDRELVGDGGYSGAWGDDLRGFHYRQVLTSVAHVAMRARHAAGTRPALYDEALSRVRAGIDLSDVSPLVRTGHRREAVFAVMVKATPGLYSAILRYR